MRRSIARLVILCVVFAAVAGTSVEARELAVVVVPPPAGADGTLYSVDLATGGFTGIAKLMRPVHALAYDGYGALYGIDAEAGVLLEIHPATGEATVIGPLGVEVDDWAVDIAFDDNDMLWMVTYGVREGAGIFTVDRTSGDARYFMTIGEQYLGGIASRGGLLYVAGSELAVIDPTSREYGSLDGEWGLRGWPAKRLAFTTVGDLLSLGVCSFCMAPFEVDGLTIIDLDGRTFELITILQADALALQVDSVFRDEFPSYVE